MYRNLRKLVYAAMCLALCLVLPFLTGQIPEIGKRLCPMHIPVLLCGFICGWSWGLLVGAVAPILRSVLFHMPVMYTNAVCMAFELAAYGAVAGILYKLLPRKPWNVYVSLICAMIAGRIVWGVVKWLLLGFAGNEFTFKMFLAGAFTDAIPGIILQIVLIPPIILALDRAGLVLNNGEANV